MPRLIDADALTEMEIERCDTTDAVEIKAKVVGRNHMRQIINDAPTVDAVQVVQCRDCKHRVVNEHYGKKGYMNLKAYCELDTGDIFELGRNAEDDDWFCEDGERKDGERDVYK